MVGKYPSLEFQYSELGTYTFLFKTDDCLTGFQVVGFIAYDTKLVGMFKVDVMSLGIFRGKVIY
jgi:hypothetical protein